MNQQVAYSGSNWPQMGSMPAFPSMSPSQFSSTGEVTTTITKTINGISFRTVQYDIPVVSVGDIVRYTNPQGNAQKAQVETYSSDNSFLIVLPDRQKVWVNLVNGHYKPRGGGTIAFAPKQ